VFKITGVLNFKFLNKNNLKKGDSDINSILTFIAVMLGGLFLLGLLYRPLLLVLLFVIVLLAILGVFYLISEKLKKETDDVVDVNIVKSIKDQLKLCRTELEKNEKETNEIKLNIEDLEKSLDQEVSLNEANRKETKRLLSSFYKELDLRKTKVEFYETCKSKLETLLYNFKYAETLRAKEAKLAELQEDHYVDIAKMESLRSDLSYNKRYLETIESLSLKMLESNSLDAARRLQLELKEITKELRRL